MNKRPRLLKNFKEAIGNLRLALVDILKFELIYRLLVMIILFPLLKIFMEAMLGLSGYSVLINADIKNFLTSLMGVISILILSFLSVLIVFYEFSVILLILNNKAQGKKLTISECMDQAFYKLGAVLNFSYLGMAVYTLALIPLLNLGLKSSLIPSLKIPGFIVGEVEKYRGGEFLIGLAMVLGIILFSKLFLVLPIMVFEEVGFDRAAKKSIGIMKGNVQKLALLIILVLGAIGLGGFLSAYLIGLVNNIWINSLFIILLLIFTALSLIVSPIIISLSYAIYDHIEDIDPDFKRGRLLSRFGGISSRVLEAWLGLSGLINRYKKISLFIFIIILFGLSNWINMEIMYDYPEQQLVIGHRGSRAGVENSLEAIISAKDQGADYAEVDILLSKDNVPMVVHDTNLLRLTGQRKNIYDLRAEEIGRLSIRDGKYSSKILSLEEMIEKTRGRINLLIELKTHGYEKVSLVDEMAKIIERYGLEDDYIFQTLEKDLLLELEKKYPQYRKGYIIVGGFGNLSSKNLSSIPADFLVFEESMVNKKLVRNVHRLDKPIYVWTINKEKSARQLFSIDVDGIITDYPRMIINVRDGK